MDKNKLNEEVLKKELDKSQAKVELLKYYIDEIKAVYRQKEEELLAINAELVNKNKTINEQFCHLHNKENEILQMHDELMEKNNVINEQFSYLYLKEEELIIANQVLKSKEEKMRLLNTEIIRNAKHKSDFLSNMSHELRTPLNSILGFSDILLDDNFGILNEKQTKFINNIQNSGRHLLELINDVLDMSKMEAGKVDLHVEQIEIEYLVENVVDNLAPLALRKNILISVDIRDDIKFIEGDELKIRQIIYNVVGNAIKFTPEKGEIKITIENYISETSENYTKITVSDNGIGIKKEYFSKIFSEFDQVENIYTKENPGTGLGLSLTKKLVERHKGDIWFTSEYGVGTSFYITLPKNIAEQKQNDVWTQFNTYAPTVDYADDLSMSLDTVIVYEPEESARELLSVILSEECFRVVFVDGIDALSEMIKKENPVLAIIDIKTDHAPENLYIKIKKALVQKPIALLLLTDNDDKRLRYKYGYSDVLLLPLDEKELNVKIKNVIEKHGRRKARELVIIDDDINIIELVYSFFESDEVVVRGFSDAREGLNYLVNSPDLVLLDLMMPGLDGFELLKELEKQNNGQKNIIIFSLKELSDEERAFLNKRVIKVIDKANFSRETFVRDVKKILAVKA